jgi:hypothetical protein
MKVKTLVTVVASSLLAASFAYAASSTPNTKLVDDATSSQPSATDSMQNPGAMDNTATNSMPTTPSDTTNNGASDSSTNPGSDESTPDTATGDAGDGDY